MTMRSRILTAIAAAAWLAMCGAVVQEAAADKVYEVTGNRVNLRAGPSLEGEIVGVVSRGDRLIVRRNVGDWAEVKPPDNVSFWVHGAFVQDDVVTAAQLNVRAAPDIRSASLGKLTSGDKVKARAREGDWMEIAAPDGITTWINRPFIAEPSVARPVAPAPAPVIVAPEPRKKPEAKPVVASTKKPAAAAKPAPAATPRFTPSRNTETRAATSDQPLRGRAAQYEGVVRKAAWVLHRPSEYTLVARQGGRAVTVCYLKHDPSVLEPLVGRKVLASGREYLVDGVRHSVLDAARIEAL